MKRFRLKLITASVLFMGVMVYALTAGTSAAASPTLSRAYRAQGAIVSGSIVRLVTGSRAVTPANTADTNGLIGVSEASNGSLLAINPSSTTVQVATAGVADTLVSTIGGDIVSGDKIAVSPFGGMGMKSASGDHVIGVAEGAFNSSTSGAKQQTITDLKGQNANVSVGLIPVSIAIGVDTPAANQLNGLQRFAHSLTGHVIPTARVVIALVLAVLAFGTLVTLTYSATYGSIISIGRNPLAKGVILQSLRFIVTATAVIGVVAGLLVYLLLI